MSENDENKEDLSKTENSQSSVTELDTALQDITTTMPKVSEHVVNLQHEEKKEAENAEIEEKPKKRGRGRPRKNPNAPKSKTPKSKTPSQNQEPNPQIIETRNRQIAVMTASAIVEQTGVLFGGSEAKFNENEKMMLEVSFEKYMESKGISDFPPGVALAVGLGSYYARVITTKPAQGRLVRGFQWLKSKVNFKRSKNAPYINRGNDNERENDTSKENS